MRCSQGSCEQADKWRACTGLTWTLNPHFPISQLGADSFPLWVLLLRGSLPLGGGCGRHVVSTDPVPSAHSPPSPRTLTLNRNAVRPDMCGKVEGVEMQRESEYEGQVEGRIQRTITSSYHCYSAWPSTLSVHLIWLVTAAEEWKCEKLPATASSPPAARLGGTSLSIINGAFHTLPISRPL